MFFEAEVKRKKYRIDVEETKKTWLVKLQAQGETAENFEISKHDYSKFDDAISFIFHGKSYMIDLVANKDGYTVFAMNSFRNVIIRNDEKLLHESLTGAGALGSGDSLTAGMPGKIVKIFVKPGDRITAGGPLLIMEAMKMENEMKATHDCVVKDIVVKEGASVDTGATLVTFES